MSLQIIYDEIKKLDRKLNSMQNDINILKKEIKNETKISQDTWSIPYDDELYFINLEEDIDDNLIDVSKKDVDTFLISGKLIGIVKIFGNLISIAFLTLTIQKTN